MWQQQVQLHFGNWESGNEKLILIYQRISSIVITGFSASVKEEKYKWKEGNRND